MQCNINRKGRIARTITGILTVTAAVVLLALGMLNKLTGWWVWPLGIFGIAFGAFQIFEARKGWCAMRAMGFKTPM